MIYNKWNSKIKIRIKTKSELKLIITIGGIRISKYPHNILWRNLILRTGIFLIRYIIM